MGKELGDQILRKTMKFTKIKGIYLVRESTKEYSQM